MGKDNRDEEMRCDQHAGTVYTGPMRCGKPAKFRLSGSPWSDVKLVCGIHARSIRARHWGTLDPLSAEPPPERGEGGRA